MTAENDVYDYIVCGGGTTGCVVAARLAEDSRFRILLLEAGRDSADIDTVKMTGGWAQNFGGEDDWNIISEPSKGLNGRRIYNSRGRFLGGSSCVNGTLCIRGPRQDYDNWELEGWSGEEVYKYMAKFMVDAFQQAETFHNKDWFHPETKAHGNTGPLHTTPHDLAPISKLVLESYQEAGLPLHEDMFTTGETPTGSGHAPRTVHDGIRSTGADFVSDRARWPNLDIRFNATVDKVTLSKNLGGDLQATGVDVVFKDGSKNSFKARKEVVISGGAYCSPAILLRSGIGPKEDLEELKIPVMSNVPGVGKNLQDHLLTGVFYEVTEPNLTRDAEIYYEGRLASSLDLWKTTKTGVLSTFPFGAFAYGRLDDRLSDSVIWQNAPRESGRDPMGLTAKQPNIEFWNTECYGGPPQWMDFPSENKHSFAIITLLLNARSRGSVKLRSADPTENPIVDHNYLEDPLDTEVLAEGTRWSNEMMMNGKATNSVIKGSWPENLKHHAYKTREEWIPYVKQNATTCYHPGGSCKMGRKEDPTAVVDERLRVMGIKGLRVADVSIMPTLNQGHTQMPAYAIGEKAADMLKADA